MQVVGSGDSESSFFPCLFSEVGGKVESEEWGGAGEHVKRLKTYNSHLGSDETEYD